MESNANSDPRNENDAVTIVGSLRAVETMDDEHRADYLIERLEEMFAKLEKRSLKSDEWEGEDEEAKERGEEKRRCKPKRPAKEKLLPNISETAKAGRLGDAEEDLAMLHLKEKNRFTFRNGFKTSTVAKDRKLKSEEEIQKTMNLALQRHDKVKRRRKHRAKNVEKLENRKENILSVSKEHTEFDEERAIPRLDFLNVPHVTEGSMTSEKYTNERSKAMAAVHAQLLSTFNTEALKLKTATYAIFKQKKEQMEAVHMELKTLFTSGGRKPSIANWEKAKAKREQMMNVHDELKRQTFLKGLCIEDDDDAGFIPRKLFMFGIEEFRKIVFQTNIAPNCSVEVPSCSSESVHDRVEESKAPFNVKKRSSIGQKFLKFFGFR